MPFAEASTNVTIPALVSGAVALIGPTLGLARWIQEKSTKHRSHDEMQRSRELFEFIRRYPKMSATAGSSGSAVLARAQWNPAQSMTNIGNLFEKRALKAAPPNELAWPEACSCFMRPGSWGASICGYAPPPPYYLYTSFSMLAIVALGNNDSTDTFEWRPPFGYFHNPLFWISLSSWGNSPLAVVVFRNDQGPRWDGTFLIRTGRQVFSSAKYRRQFAN